MAHGTPEQSRAQWARHYEKHAERRRQRKREGRAEARKQYLSENAERLAIEKAESGIRRKAKSKATKGKWREANREKNRGVLRAAKRRRRAIPGLRRADKVRDEAAKLNATPGWADLFLISEIYRLSKLKTEITGVLHAVDHIVPLRSPYVCGLHCEANLRVIPWIENSLKGNRNWPDMPDPSGST